MIHKRFITFLTIFSLFLFIPLIPANAAVKAGGACKKIGATSVVLNKNYKCVKSGKKLIWKKVISKTNAPISKNISISIDSLDLNSVPKNAYENIAKVLNSRSRTNITPIKFIGTNVIQSRVDQELSGLNRAIDLWAPYFQPDKFQVIYVVKGDEDWADKKSIELGLSSMIPPGETLSQRMNMWNPCGFAIAGMAQQTPTFVQCLNVPYVGGYKQTGPHEYTHLFQRGYGGSNMYKIPWYAEGSASYFGWTLGFYPYDPNSFDRSSWLDALFFNMDADSIYDFKSKDIERFKKRMKMLTPNSMQSTANVSYWAGGLATETLVALYGFDKFVEFTKNLQSSQDMSVLLNQTYGFSEDYFYEKLAPYVWAQMPK